MYLTFNKTGNKPIAIDLVSKKIIYLTNDNSKSSSKYIISNYNSHFRFLPHNNIFRELIIAKSGTGKSYRTNIFISLYRMLYPNNKILLCSGKPDSINDYDDENIINISEIVEENYDCLSDKSIEDNSLIIFDDPFFSNNQKYINKWILDLVYKTRSRGISIIVILHKIRDGKLTNSLYDEMSFFTYSNYSNTKNTEEVLKNKYGIKIDIKKEGGRFTTLYNHYPNILLTDNKIELLD